MNIPKRNTKQSGFTLIELIVVIVILGILASVALPKFINLGADARIAALKGLQASMQTTVALAHSKYVVNSSGTPITKYTAENISVAYNVGASGSATSGEGNGYLSVTDANLPTLMGVTLSNYQIVGGTGFDVMATDNSPAVKANEIAFIPNSIAGTPTGLTCFVKYVQSSLQISGNVPDIVYADPAKNPC